MIELVAEHYRLTEEYVMGRHYLWIRRKYRQAERSRYEKRRLEQVDLFHAILAAVSGVLGDGSGIDEYMLDDFEVQADPERSEKQNNVRKHDPRQFKTEPWWIPKEADDRPDD